MNTLQQLYDSEINFTISTFWDGGFDWKLGDSQNGFKASGCAETFDAAVRTLELTACVHYPDSVFANARPKPDLEALGACLAERRATLR